MTSDARLVRVSQQHEVERFSIVMRYVVPGADADTVRVRCGQQLMNVIALSSGEPTTVMVAALSDEIARTDQSTGGFDDYAQIARRLLKATLAPSACAWDSTPARAP